MNTISDLTTLNLPIVSVKEFDINKITEKMDSNPAVPDCRSNVPTSKSVPPVSEMGSVLLGGVPAEICRIYPQRQVSHAAHGPNPQITAGRLVCLFHITAWLFEGFPPRPSLPEKDWVIPAPTLIAKPSLPSAGLYIIRCLWGGGHEPAALTQTPPLCGPPSNKRPVTEPLAGAQPAAGTVRGHLTAGERHHIRGTLGVIPGGQVS